MIKIGYNKNIDTSAVRDVEQYFQEIGTKTEAREQEGGISNSMWWLLPPLLGVWIAKPFIDGFLGELGKDAAEHFKNALYTAYTKLRNSPVRAYNRDDLEKIKDGADPASVGHSCPSISIGFQIEQITKLRWGTRFILPAELSDTEIKKALSELKNTLPKIIDLERKRWLGLSENQIVLGSKTYLYDLEQGWITEDKMLLRKKKQKRKG